MILQIVLSIIIFAFVPIAIKFTSASAITICIYRLAFTVIFLSIFWRKKIDYKFIFFKLPGSFKLWLIGFAFFIHWITYAYAVKIGGAGVAVLGLSTYGMQLIFWGIIFLKQKCSLQDYLCMAISIFGLSLLLPNFNFDITDQFTLGLCLALLSAAFFSMLPILHKKSQEFNSETRIFSQFIGALAYFLFFIKYSFWSFNSIDWLLLTFLALLGTVTAHSLWALISTKLRPIMSGLLYYTIAPLTILLSAYFLNEHLNFRQAIGAGLVMVSALINILVTDYKMKSSVLQ